MSIPYPHYYDKGFGNTARFYRVLGRGKTPQYHFHTYPDGGEKWHLSSDYSEEKERGLRRDAQRISRTQLRLRSKKEDYVDGPCK